MNLLPIKFITRHQAKLLFIVVWAHVTILDLFYVTYSGPVFFWQETFQPSTIFIHLSVASATLIFYFMFINIVTRVRSSHTPQKSQSNAKPNSKPDKSISS